MTRSRRLLGIFGLLILGAVAGCGGKPAFQEFSSPEGKFKAAMPGVPKQETKKEAGGTMHVFGLEGKNAGYVVIYADVPVLAKASDAILQKSLDGSRDGVIRSLKGTLTKESHITLNNKYPGRAIEAAVPNGGTMHLRLYLVNGRLYQMMSTGSKAEPAKFFDSFALLE